MKQKFFTDISHEIRTPLTMVTGPIEYLINNTNTPESIKKQLLIVEQSTNRLLKLVNQILDLRKIQNRRLKIEETDLVSFTEKICVDFMQVSQQKAINFRFKSLTESALVWVDQESLDKMIVNLISNAFKYCPAGRSIDVVVTKNEKYSAVSVTDNGPGISKEKQEKLFVRFANFNDDPSKPSTGIGLSLVKELADKHSANIQVKSEVGKGSSFTISFLNGYLHYGNDVDLISSSATPKVVQEGNVATNAEAMSKEDLQKSNTKPIGLIVEDDIDLRSFMRTILEEDYIIYEAEDGIQGFDQAISINPDFIISDIMMPGKDGIELLKCLRNNVDTSHIPIILLTAKNKSGK